MTYEDYKDERADIVTRRKKLNIHRRDLDERWLNSLFYPVVKSIVKLKALESIDASWFNKGVHRIHKETIITVIIKKVSIFYQEGLLRWFYYKPYRLSCKFY